MPPISFKTWVFRPKDLLIFQVEFRNVNFSPPAAGSPAKITGGSDAFMIVHFQTQHITEEAFFQASDIDQSPEEAAGGQPLPPTGNEPLDSPGDVGVALAGPSQ